MTDYANTLAKIEARQLVTYGDSWMQSWKDRAWLLEQHRAASEALTAAGIQDDGRPLAERVKTLADRVPRRMFHCCECGGDVRPIRSCWRVFENSAIERYAIPDDLDIPTCTACGETFVNPPLIEEITRRGTRICTGEQS